MVDARQQGNAAAMHAQFHSALAECPHKPFLISPQGQYAFADVHRQCSGIAGALRALPGDRLACYMADSPQLVMLMLGAALGGKSLLVLNRADAADSLAAKLAQFEVDYLITDCALLAGLPCPQTRFDALLKAGEQGDSEAPDSEGELLILTSGTTGSAKCARYQWSDLLAQVRDKPEPEDVRWLLAYRLNHFAGVQMLAHVLRNRGTLVLAGSDRVPDALAAIERFAVTHMSSTPTFWRFALALLQQGPQDSERNLPLRHITLGSEAVSAGLLQDLKTRFPAARIVHIYASTEAGSLVSVDDMKAGLPAAILSRPPGAAIRFRIEEGELQVKSRHGMRDYLNADTPPNYTADGWLATGDMVRLENDRIHFMGRRSETINVGGVKVHPLEVEAVITALPGVGLARVYGQDNPVVGQVVAVDLVVCQDSDAAAVEQNVRQACMALPRHSRPARINLVDTLETSNHKLVRR